MSWYLFQKSPERQYRGIKVDGYQNMQRRQINLDWGLGELSYKKLDQPSMQKRKIASKNSNTQQYTQPVPTKNDKSKIIEQTVKILTQSSDQQSKQELLRVLKKYQQKYQQSSNYPLKKNISRFPAKPNYNDCINKSLNVLKPFEFDSKNENSFKSRLAVDSQTAQRMRFLENSLLPEHKKDNVGAILNFDLNQKIGDSMSDSRVSGKSHFGNKKNQSAIRLGDGFNSFMPIKEKIKDMNQKLKQMYEYDEWCKKREAEASIIQKIFYFHISPNPSAQLII